MAAIKRSQANQRRQPENFHLFHQISQQSSSSTNSSISCIKVELQHLILSILDDPVVSRVFAEAGFRSSEIKLAIVRPLPQLLRYSHRSRGPPLFLCNVSDFSDPGRRGFAFPFSGFLAPDDDNCKRIGDVMIRKNKGRNPLLVGVCAYSALQSFTETIEKQKDDSVLPIELSGLNVVSIENEVSKFVTENGDKGSLSLKFNEVGSMVEQNLGPGLVVNFGDLKTFVMVEDTINNNNDNNNKNSSCTSNSEAVRYVVDQLTSLLELHGGKVWLIGAAASYESYLKFLTKFPSIEKDWELQLLPITSLRPSSMTESYPRSSLMESFVPFGGFFSTPSDLKVPLSSSYQCMPRCHQCNEHCEEEVIAVSKGGLTASVADRYQSSLPSWLQMTELGTNKGLDTKTKDDGVVLSAKVTGVQKKWDNICQRLHHTQSPPEEKTFPTVLGFRFVEDKKENADNHSCNNTDASSNETDCVNVDPCMPMRKITTLQSSNSFPLVSKPKNESLLSKQWGKPLNAEDLESGGLNSPHCSVSNSSMGDSSRTSPTSATSVTTDLGLGICSSPTSNKPKKCTHQNSTDLPQGFSGRFSTDVDVVNGNISSHLTRSSSFSSPDYGGLSDRIDPKMLFRALSERVGWQDEAIRVISQRIACWQTRSKKRHGASLRADIWFNFVGPDRLGKKKIALALAEKLHESQEHFISMDLSSQDGMINSNTIFGLRGMNGYDIKFRGKTLVDCLAEELTKKPLSIAFLENVDKADVLTQNSLSQAIRTGKLSDSHGRDISINNTIFVTTSTFSMGNYPHTVRREPSKYSAERILAVKWWPMQIRIGHAFGDNTKSQSMNVSETMRKDISNPVFLNKRKLVSGTDSLGQPKISEMAKRAHKTSTRYLDLNLPAEENEVCDSNDGNSDKDSISENSKAWLQDFSDHVDKTVVFKPFDFDALADKLLKEVTKSFHKIVGSNCFLEIDSKVMDQLLAASYIPDRNTVVEDWVERVLSRAFAEVPNRYNLTAHSVVKLATCEGLCVEELAPEVYLPSRIILN